MIVPDPAAAVTLCGAEKVSLLGAVSHLLSPMVQLCGIPKPPETCATCARRKRCACRRVEV
jgi:hypothetical protein